MTTEKRGYNATRYFLTNLARRSTALLSKQDPNTSKIKELRKVFQSRLPARRSRIGRTGCPSNQDAAGTSARRRLARSILQPRNGKLLQHDERCTAPAYQWMMDNQCRPLFVQLTRPVLTGEKILVDYGYSADRQTRWGVGPKANLSTVKSEYAFRP